MRMRGAIKAAKEDGASVGVATASWVTDGNTTDETYRRILKGIEDGDPEILDSFRVPDLSGEFAGDPTPQSLSEEYGLENAEDWVLDEVCDAWMNAASDAFWSELERICRFHVAA